MTSSLTRNHDPLLTWMAATLLFALFVFGDTAIVAMAASLVTLQQLAAVSAAFLLIGAGLIFTTWQLRRSI